MSASSLGKRINEYLRVNATLMSTDLCVMTTDSAPPSRELDASICTSRPTVL